MNYNKEYWDKTEYQLFLQHLSTLSDAKYQKFHQGLVTSGKKLRGIRTPILKQIAKEISKGNFQEFLDQVKNDSYEEIILYGLVISYLKEPFSMILSHLDKFIPMIDNWAINDIVAANLKCFKKNQELGYSYIQKLLISNNPWSIRFALVLLLDYYINDTYIDHILDIVSHTTHEDYYVKMANAWLVSICYIKYPEKTTVFLLNNKMDKWTFNKIISKICDSYRVDHEDKDYLRTLRR